MGPGWTVPLGQGTILLNGDGEPREIKNKYPPYEGYLIQKMKNNEPTEYRTHVFRTINLSAEDKPRATVLVYDYTSTTPVDGGTYVVLRFKESGMYFTSLENSQDSSKFKLALRKPEFFAHPDPKDMSVYATQQLDSSQAITLDQAIEMPAKLEREATSTSDEGLSADSQRFQLFWVNDEEAGEQSEESQCQEVQHHD
ncbi:hypothetical protein Bbelb_373440 [Branchiostoma belcheri]|nr:hypothetical protein Bbelb_373440 [Branchiostoma belcheri]